MSEAMQVYGMVLSSMPAGESDRRVVLLTRELGRISAFARGARRPGSALMASSGPLAFGRFSLIRGQSAYVLVQASIDQYFLELAQDPEAIWYGYYFLDLAGYYGREGIPAADTLNLLYLSLKALMHEKLDNRLVRRIFELRLMVINGEYAPPKNLLSGNTLYTVQYICRAPLEKLYSFTVSPEILKELGSMLDAHMDRIIDRPLKSRKVLDEMTAGTHGGSPSGRQDPEGGSPDPAAQSGDTEKEPILTEKDP